MIFFRINPKGGSHCCISLTDKMEKLCLHFRPLSHHAWLGAHFALQYRSSGSSLSEISYCYSQCSPVSASDFLDRNTCTYMPQCRLRKPAVVGSLASHIKKTLNSQMVHPVLLEGVGPQAYVLCNWYRYIQWVQMGFVHLSSPVSASSQKIQLGCSQPGKTLSACNYCVE